MIPKKVLIGAAVNKAYIEILHLQLLDLLFRSEAKPKSAKTKTKPAGKLKPNTKSTPVQRKHANSFVKIYPTLDEMIKLRHKIVHTAFLDPNLSNDRVEMYGFAAESFVFIFAKYLREKAGFRILLDEYTL